MRKEQHSRRAAVRRYHVGASVVDLGFGDIRDSQAEVIVSSDDHLLSMGGGVSGAIAEAGGSAVRLDALKAVPCGLGDVVVTSAGALDARHVFHAVTIAPDRPVEAAAQRQLIGRITSRCLTLVETMGLSSIAFPAVGAGVAGISPESVAFAMAEAIDQHVRSTTASLSVELHLMPKRWQDQTDYIGFFEEFGVRLRAAPTVMASTSHDARSEDDPVGRRRQRALAVEQERVAIERSILQSNETGGAAPDRLVADYVSKTRELGHELEAPSIRLFFSYSHDDRQEAGEFIKHLAGLRLAGIATWSDQAITPGASWDDTISHALEEADVALFLVTASFLSSDYCVGKEWQRARERRAAGEMTMIPVILKACDWQPLVGDLQALPVDGFPIASQQDFHTACLDVVTAVRNVIDSLANTG